VSCIGARHCLCADSVPVLSEFAQQVLAVVQRLKANAYGVTIRREIVESTGRNVSIGCMHVMLDQLEGAGLVASRQGEATWERGGRPKLYFDITFAGEQVLIEQDQAFREELCL